MASVSPSQDIARAAHAWPFEEARKVLARIEKRGSDKKAKDYVLFETGYGPSGLPHIGTFGEVARTTWVRRAFEAMSGGRKPGDVSETSFFRSGTSGQYKGDLTAAEIETVETALQAETQRYGFLEPVSA